MSGEAVPQSMRTDRLKNPGRPCSGTHRPLQHAFVQVVTLLASIRGIRCPASGREHILPTGFLLRAAILAGQSVRKGNRPEPGFQIPGMLCPGAVDLRLQRRPQPFRQHRLPVFAALALPHGDLVADQVHIFHSQTQTFHEPQPASIEQTGHQGFTIRHRVQQGHSFGARQHHRQPRRPFGPDHVLHPWQIQGQHFPIQEQQGGQCLVLGTGGDSVALGQIAQEALDLRTA